MDLLYTIHLIFLLGILSVPFWKKNYLRWGVYIPFVIATSWVIFYGCPITQMQENLRGDTFVRSLLSYISPDISIQQADHIIFFAFMLVTIIGFIKLCPKLITN